MKRVEYKDTTHVSNQERQDYAARLREERRLQNSNPKSRRAFKRLREVLGFDPGSPAAPGGDVWLRR